MAAKKKTLTGRLVSAGHRTEHERGIVTSLLEEIVYDDEGIPGIGVVEKHSIGVVAERMVFHLQLEPAGEPEGGKTILLDDVPRETMVGVDQLVGLAVHVRLEDDRPVAVELA